MASGSGNSTQLSRFPWFYDPLGEPVEQHPITNHLNSVKFEFANPIDILDSDLSVTRLLSSSELSRKVGTPTDINLKTITEEPKPELYTSGHFPLAVLVEGEFDSAFKNKLKPLQLSNSLDKSLKTQQVFISDGDVIKNQIQNGKPLELGIDKYSGLTYGNKRFLTNTINYLLGDKDLVATRNKSIALNEMDLDQLSAEKQKWQVFNLAAPLAAVLIFGIIFYYWRRKTYS